MLGDSVKLLDGKAQRNIAKRLFPGPRGYIPRSRVVVVRMLLQVMFLLLGLVSVYCFFLYPYNEVFLYVLLTCSKIKYTNIIQRKNNNNQFVTHNIFYDDHTC